MGGNTDSTDSLYSEIGKNTGAQVAPQYDIKDIFSPVNKSSGPENTSTADVVPKIEKGDETGVQSKPAIQPSKLEPSIQKTPAEGAVPEKEQTAIPSNGVTENSKPSKIDQALSANLKAVEPNGSVNGSGEIAEKSINTRTGEVKPGEKANTGFTKASAGFENQLAQSRELQKVETLRTGTEKLGTEKPEQAFLAGNQTQAGLPDSKFGQFTEDRKAGSARYAGPGEEYKRLESDAAEKKLRERDLGDLDHLYIPALPKSGAADEEKSKSGLEEQIRAGRAQPSGLESSFARSSVNQVEVTSKVQGSSQAGEAAKDGDASGSSKNSRADLPIEPGKSETARGNDGVDSGKLKDTGDSKDDAFGSKNEAGGAKEGSAGRIGSGGLIDRIQGVLDGTGAGTASGEWLSDKIKQVTRADLIDKLGEPIQRSLDPKSGPGSIIFIAGAKIADAITGKTRQPASDSQTTEQKFDSRLEKIERLPVAEKSRVLDLLAGLRNSTNKTDKKDLGSPKDKDIVSIAKTLKTQDLHLLMGIFKGGRQPELSGLSQDVRSKFAQIFGADTSPVLSAKAEDFIPPKEGRRVCLVGDDNLSLAALLEVA